MWGNNTYRFVIVQVNADTGRELWPRGHTFFEGTKGKHHLPKMAGEPLVHRGLIGDLPLQRRHERAEAAFKVGILLLAGSFIVEVDDIHVFKL